MFTHLLGHGITDLAADDGRPSAPPFAPFNDILSGRDTGKKTRVSFQKESPVIV